MNPSSADHRELHAALQQLEQALPPLEHARHAENPPPDPALLQHLHASLRRAQAALAVGHDQYRALLDAVPDPVSILSRDGVVLDLNKASLDAYDRTREEIIGQPLHVLNPDLRDDFLAPVLDAIDRGETHVQQATNMRADGSRFPVEVSSASLTHDGQPAIVAVARDLSTLQRDKTLFLRVQELARIGGWQWHRTHGTLYLTSETIHILGAARTPETMEDVLAQLQPADRQRLHKTLTSIDDGTGFELELQGQQADGTPFWVRMIGEPDPHDPSHDRISGTLQDITDRKLEEERLRQQAQTDALTGLLNRDAILTCIEQRLQARGGPDLALLYIDLDRFKIVNDVLGHDAGDHLLVEAAQRIRNAVAGEGVIARFGGDEFLVACHINDDDTRTERLALRIQQAFGLPFHLGNDEFKVTTSIGISRASTRGDTPRQLIQNADVAMYDSKRRHRNGYQAFTPKLASRQQERLQIETQLRRALDNGEFYLVYQPQVDLNSGRILSAEALIRWNNPVLGEMRPDRFIDLAEATGEIVRIDHWVLREASTQLRRWQDAGLPIERVAVNVSYHQFVGEDLVNSVTKALEEARLPGHALELELTERVLVEDSTDTLHTLDRLRALGVRLSIDDFGEGYSALSYLRRLPIHTLKLSYGFLKGVPDNPSDVAICQAVLGIANSLGLNIVAEGIETEPQRKFMQHLGVSVWQGFLFAPGLRPAEFGERLSAQPRP